MAEFCFYRVEKRKSQDLLGLRKEANREYKDPAKYNNKVDLSKSHENVYLVKSSDWLRDAKKAIKDAGIQKYRKDAVVALTGIYTASPTALQYGDLEGFDNDLCNEYFKACLAWHEKKYGKVISAIIHYDESTPHLHVTSVPITSDGRLCAKEIIGNKAKLKRSQDDFWEQVGDKFGLDRGLSSDRRHLTEIQYASKMALEELERVHAQSAQAKEDLHWLYESVKYAELRLSETQMQYDSYLKNKDDLIKDLQAKYKKAEKAVKTLLAYLLERDLIEDFKQFKAIIEEENER